MPPEPAQKLYDHFVAKVRETGLPIETGRFRATMEVELCNCGPVTLIDVANR